jgi:chemotaxis protein CheX
MAQLKPVAGKPSLKTSTKAPGVVSGLIALEGPEGRGSLALSFPKPVILHLYKEMMREQKSSVDKMVVDLVGELTNIVMGGAKQKFEAAGMDFGLTLPEMMEGEDHEIIHTVDGQVITLPLHIDSGTIYTEFCFKIK